MSNLCDTIQSTKRNGIQVVKVGETTKWTQGYDSRSSFPREVCLRWRGEEPPRHSNSTDVHTLFSMSFSGEGGARFHYEVGLKAMTKPLHEVEATPQLNWRLSTRSRSFLHQGEAPSTKIRLGFQRTQEVTRSLRDSWMDSKFFR